MCNGRSLMMMGNLCSFFYVCVYSEEEGFTIKEILSDVNLHFWIDYMCISEDMILNED